MDVSEGKTDQLYRAHGYHTRVPHLAIVPSILHYTKPGDIVLDRWREIGIRMALGARQGRILALVVKETMAPTAAGALAGILSALVLLEPLKRLLYGVEPDSAALFLAVGSAVLAAAFCSSLFPAFRAMHVDPATALRQE